ncbi:N-methylhydantoinase A/acetone carboxylase, beta subunit [Frankia casuarinae]|uniref:5-oxoprolinase (ATP-hydrolyzing) n=1 Tax=Frankia casuarinae (strain DSM 45818 / CECT 9043 / HFP020203 / CcI3) TaxID=106370 RepID=Q2JA18_FRACC|nr:MULTISPECIES: hydantoinase/oxoprolinase family protein [Frankia]ABD11874.1 5-oxoprolinase (ATP-hydrolyzing) [Frankia casuarinae]ETA00221.1 N-methylhydantoinase A/acetone carboxylase, beta subunit [Frankia sp. CcI6]EYT90509.1 N-methylhydantoinase A/acetone carboxylase, beta subunit [Frankia casuarinae]KDA41500.1 N-methylhydantoinase A/acetone carboxylase, beta subunit [Frankia sp. BMG5.23]OHV51165.1 hydantoinase [Frankia sp. CgIS1]
MKRISVDIGGTFTDCFFVWDETYVEAKALTTHHNLALGFNEALDLACSRAGLDRGTVLTEVDSVRYATTLGTNALIERKGPKVGAIVTHGFEDTIPLSRGRGYGEGLDYSMQQNLPAAERPEPLVPRYLIRSVKERVNSAGTIVARLDPEDVRTVVRELVDAGAEALVVSLVNATENPEHELAIQEIILDEFPAHELGAIPVLLGHQVSGRKGEYVRATSTIVDGFLHEIMFHALSQLSNNLRDAGYGKPMLVIHNSGGMAQMNSTDALQTIHSGPIAGVGAAEHLSNETGLGHVISTDMGGTSFDIGLVPEGGVKHYDFLPTIDRWLVSVPMVHLDTLGAGGGSIASYDRIHNSIKIGPESAGSNPGPACYDRGGLRPTVTDADLLLGYLDPDNYANGYIKLNPKRSRFAVEENLCDQLDMDVLAIARAIKDGVDEQMAIGIGKELRVRGYLPEDFTMLAYGGNGPLHACGIARHAGIKQILAPPFSSVFSACGAGNMKQLHFHERGVHITMYNATSRSLYDKYEEFNAIVEELEARGREDLVRQGFAADDVKYRLELDMRYGNQLLTQAVALDINRMNGVGDVLHMIRTFGDVYSHRFGASSAAPEAGIRVGTVRVASYVDGDVVNFDSLEAGGERTVPTEVSHRKVYFIGQDDSIETPVYDQAALSHERVIPGPAIVTTENTTYLVEPGWRLEPTVQGAVWFLQD